MHYIQGTDRFSLTFSSLDDFVDNVNPVRIIEDFINKLDKDFLRFVHILRQKDQQNQKQNCRTGPRNPDQLSQHAQNQQQGNGTGKQIPQMRERL